MRYFIDVVEKIAALIIYIELVKVSFLRSSIKLSRLKYSTTSRNLLSPLFYMWCSDKLRVIRPGISYSDVFYIKLRLIAGLTIRQY